jgi:Tol biopolymer transport system component
VFVRDRSLQTTERVSVSSAESEGDGHSHSGTISADGRFVCFVSAASNLVPDDTNFSEDIFVRDLAAGTTERVSVGSVAEQSNSPSTLASISADGRWVAFISSADNLVAGDTNEELDIFLHDRQTGLTERVSTGDAEQEADAASAGPSVSEDGNLVAFWSDATNLVAGDTNGMRDVFVRDRAAGTTERASVSSEGVEADGNSQDPAVRGFLASSPQITADGRYVVFFSSAANLVPDDTNTCGPLFRDRPGHCPDVFVRDRTAGTTTRVNVSADGMQADDRSADPVISASGLAVAFSSAATNLVSFDANACPGFPNCPDIFVHDALPTVVREARYDEGATAAAALSVSVEPNPVAAAFDLRVTGPSSEEMTLIVYDTSGRAVRMLARGRLASTLVRWDGTDIKGNRVEPGTYIAKLSSSEESVTGKITMVEK